MSDLERGTVTAANRWATALLWGLPLAFLAVFFAYPVGTLLVTALRPDGAWDLSPIAETLTDPDLLGVIWFTVWQAAVSTALTLLVAVPGAWVLARFRFPGRGLVEALAVVAFVMPTVVVATAIAATLAPDGPLGWLVGDGADRGLPAIFAAHVYFNLAVVLRMVGSYWSLLDPAVEESAAALGASPMRVFWRVTLPRLKPSLYAAGAIVYLFTFTSFGVVLLLGEIGQATIEVEIQRQVLVLFNLPVAAALSIVQLVLVLAMLRVQGRLAARASAEQDLHARPRLRLPRAGRQRASVAAFLVVSLTVLLGPVLMVFDRALRGSGGYSLRNYELLSTSRAGTVLFVPPGEAVRNSVLFAVAATVIALLVGGAAALAMSRRERSAAEAVWLLPLGVSAVTLGFGMLITFDEPPINFRGSAALVPIAQSLVAIPFVIRALLPVLRSIRGSIKEAAAVLGASPAQVVRLVELPMVSRSLAVAAGFAFAISLGEFGATIFLARSDYPTIPIAIYRYLGTPGPDNYGQAMALSSLLIVITAVAVLMTDRLRIGGSRYV